MLASPGIRRLAAVVSFLGHPLVTTTAFVAFVAKRWLAGPAAAWALGSVALVVGLISLWNLRKTRRGTFSNFDVSEQKQRNAFYPVLLVLLGLATAVLLWQQPGSFPRGMAAVWLMLLGCYLLNFWLKVSLHAALSFFLAFTLLHLHHSWGLWALVLAVLVAGSRLVLGRHTQPELLVGAGVGLATGGALVWFL